MSDNIKFIFIVIGAIIGSTIGAYLKSFFSKKGENLATKEDFDEILSQTKRTKEVTEEIKNELSLAKSTYDQYLHEILDYYSISYKYYRLC